MATDYKKIVEDHEKRYGYDTKHLEIYKKLYSEKTHFIYELIQNADDSKSQNLKLQLYEKGLLIWNDGSQFSDEDVRKICSLYSSNKDLTKIGSFGIGFKAVYNYTKCPEIYSGAERFLIRDLIKPECIPNMKSNVAELVKSGKTVFRIPFKEGLSEGDINKLEKRLRELNKHTLLFLRNLKKVHWRDERKKQNGAYHCTRRSHDIIQNAEEVELTALRDDNNQTTDTFLVFRKEVHPPEDVINQLIQQEEYDEDRQRIELSRDKLQPIEVAFKIQDERIIEMDSCVLFAYLPTQMKTNLRFLIQARYQTTPARDNIISDNSTSDNSWNKWLMNETAKFLPDVLEELKEAGLLTPTFYNVLPLKIDKVHIEFELISSSLSWAMQKNVLVPTQNGKYEKAENVLYPHREPLRHLIKDDWMDTNKWLHPEIRQTQELGRCFKVMEEAGVKVAYVKRVLKWLETRTTEWFKKRSNDWLCVLYLYLNKQKSEMKQIKDLPLVRLEDGSHICASKSPVFFPPNTSEERKGIAPFINELPIVQSTFLEENEGPDIKSFLKSIGVKTIQPVHLIDEYILPKYLESDKEPTEELNRVHLHYLQTVWSKKPTELSKLKTRISNTPILLAYREGERESLCLKKPCQVYLPETYTGNADLETYFSGSNNVWYVDDGYLDDNSDLKNWRSFFERIGVSDTPRVIKKNGESHLDGLQAALEKISSDKSNTLSIALWHLLIKAQSFDVISCTYLKETAWVPDEHGDFYCPSVCFEPTNENKNVLGDSVVYLHPDFDIREDNKDARALAEKLGIQMYANTDSVMDYLQTLSGSPINIDDIIPLYSFLHNQGTPTKERFTEFPLIITLDPEPRWWKSNEVFWDDESVVFGKNRGYLCVYYPEELKPFFTTLGVNERAAPLDYVHGIQEIASVCQAEISQVRERAHILYRRLWQSLQEGGDWQKSKKWEQTREDQSWLGKIGEEFGFYSSENLVYNDHTHIAQMFEGVLSFWEFNDDLLDLAKYLGIEGCSQAKVKFNPIGKQEEDPSWSVKVQNLYPYIHDFLNSPGMCEAEKEKSADILKTLSLRLVEELETKYILKEISHISPNPRPSFLDVSDQEVTLWLALESDKNLYPLLIGGALQDYFGVKDLGWFTEHLLTEGNIHWVLNHWKHKGLRTELCESRVESVTKDVQGESQESDNDEVSDSNKENVNGSMIIEDENNSNGVVDPIIPLSDNAHVTKTTEINGSQNEYSPLWNITSQPTSESIIIQEEGTENDRDREESQEHKRLKYNLAANPSQFGAGLILVKIEYEFKSKDRVDILLKDSSGHPVPVEVETKYSIESWRELGVWQAVKYKHLAAVEYGLPCDQVRSILAAPIIPEDVKAKCKELGIEPIEVHLP